MDETIIVAVVVATGIGALLGIGIGAGVEQFTDSSWMFACACIVGALGGVIGWIWADRQV